MRPLRLKNMTQLELGTQIAASADGYDITIPPERTKNWGSGSSGTESAFCGRLSPYAAASTPTQPQAPSLSNAPSSCYGGRAESLTRNASATSSENRNDRLSISKRSASAGSGFASGKPLSTRARAQPIVCVGSLVDAQDNVPRTSLP